MRNHLASLLVGLVVTAAAQAQNRSGQVLSANDVWQPRPAPAATIAEPAAGKVPLPGVAAGSGHFDFADEADGPAGEPPPRANDKAAVMGEQRPWQGGRPPLDCAVTPHDAACH